MATEQKKAPDFDDIVFEIRNKEYGAYILRRNYNRNLIISLLIAMLIMATAVIAPFLSAKALDSKQKRTERQVEIKMENLDQAVEPVKPPEPPPPPPSEVVQQAKYIPPVVVDSVKPEDTIELMTADEAVTEVMDEEVVEVIETVKEEVQETETEAEPFVVVEEMPMFPGGPNELMKYIGEHLRYPEIAAENNIQGRVTVQFCVTPTGGVDRVSVLKAIDPELDAEAVRVVKALPKFKPGKQGGVPVPVWYTVPIKFEIKTN